MPLTVWSISIFDRALFLLTYLYGLCQESEKPIKIPRRYADNGIATVAIFRRNLWQALSARQHQPFLRHQAAVAPVLSSRFPS
ncbi:hypothetical protein Dda3937_04393 [Dickeya dadantii 3937]|uniref:Uncharacterized protein n=1 Tax=Dickeya dadantii (strain 3937) TaxID=198628 RepID=E0SDN2_DICD3|nr:hypothetical protein Dda3937_04393 [Dickeya dadantii 3937]